VIVAGMGRPVWRSTLNATGCAALNTPGGARTSTYRVCVEVLFAR